MTELRFHLIAYKPDSSRARCGRGCCGYDSFDADFVLERNMTLQEIKDRVVQIIGSKAESDEADHEFTLLPSHPEDEALEAGDEMLSIVTNAKELVVAKAAERAKIEADQKLAADERARQRRQAELEAKERAEFDRLSKKYLP